MTLMYRRGLPDNVMPDVGALTAFYYFATQVLHVLATFVYRLLLVAAGVYAVLQHGDDIGQLWWWWLLLLCIPPVLHMPFFKQLRNAPHLARRYRPFQQRCWRLALWQSTSRAVGVYILLLAGYSQWSWLPLDLLPPAALWWLSYTMRLRALVPVLRALCALVFLATDCWLADRRRKAYDAHYEIYSDNRWRDVNHPCHYAQEPDAATLRRHRAATAGLDANELADEIDMFQLSDEAKSRPRTTHPFATPAGAPRLGAPVVPQQVTQHVPWHAAQTGARPLNSFGHHNAFRAAMNTDIRSINQASIPRGFYLTEESTHGRTPITQQELASSRFGGLLHGERRKFWQQQAPSVTSPPFAGLRSTSGSQWLSVRPSVRPLALQSRRRRTDQIATSSSDESDADYAHDDDEDDGDNKYGTYRPASARAYEPASVPAVPRRSGPGRMKTEERGSDDMEEDDDDDQFGTTSVLNNMQQQTRYPQQQQTLRGPAWKAPGSQTTWLRKPVAFDLHPVLAVPDELDAKISERLFL